MSLPALFNNRIKQPTGLFVNGNGMYFSASFNWLFFTLFCEMSGNENGDANENHIATLAVR
jgi:hypothetical protein